MLQLLAAGIGMKCRGRATTRLLGSDCGRTRCDANDPNLPFGANAAEGCNRHRQFTQLERLRAGPICRRPCGVRCQGGVTLIRAFARNLRTCPAMTSEKAQAATTARPKVMMRLTGANRPVVVMKRVQCSWSDGGGSPPLSSGSTGFGQEEPEAQRKAAAFAR